MRCVKCYPLNVCGFTIVEILLVVVLIALIAGAGGGIYVGTYKKMTVEKSARDFLLAAKYARIMAIERQSLCRIELDQSNGRFALVVEELNEQTGDSERVIVQDEYFRPVKFEGDVKFEDIKISPIDGAETFRQQELQTIVFLPNGTAQSAVIQIGDGRGHYTVNISAATGRVTMYVGTVDELKIGTIDLDEE